MPKRKLKLLPLVLLIAMVAAFLPSMNSFAASTKASTNYSNATNKSWKWYGPERAKHYGTKKNYAYLGFWKIKGKYYAFDQHGSLIRNAFLEDKWVDNKGVLHPKITGKWVLSGNKWRYKVSNKQKFKQAGYLSGKKTEWFGTSANGKSLSSVMSWTWSGGTQESAVTFTKKGYAKMNGKVMIKGSYKKVKNQTYEWSKSWNVGTFGPGSVDPKKGSIRTVKQLITLESKKSPGGKTIIQPY